MSNTRSIISIIEEELASKGAVSFARFMELALYCPNFGYYERRGGSPGRAGDFFTSVSVGPMFGELLAGRFAGWLGQMPGGRRHIVEAGAHDGRLALDILRRLQTRHPVILESLDYWILEPSAIRRQSQEETLGEFAGRVRWFGSWEEAPTSGIHGVIFSNELLDAMPVHRLSWDARAKIWFEWGVTLENGRFAWTRLGKLEGGVSIPALPEKLLAVLPDGFATEVCPAAVAWWRSAADALRGGKLLAFDYGLTAEQFFHRSDATEPCAHTSSIMPPRMFWRARANRTSPRP